MRTRWLMITALALLARGAVLAQSSSSYRLQEHTFNDGGRPVDAVVSASASFRLTLDSVGEPIARRGLAGASFVLDGGLAPIYAPPGEVRGLELGDDRQTLTWSPEPASTAYNLYVGALSGLPDTYGACLSSRIEATSTVDPSLPGPGEGLFYVVTGENRLFEEGTMGTASGAVERVNSGPCP